MLKRVLNDRYALIEKIGCGGMAVVYKARCQYLNRNVAIKILRSELVDDEEFVFRFKKESQSVASLSHPNIVSVYDVGEDNNTHYIVMEYVNGTTLKEYIKKIGSLDMQTTIDIGMKIASAIKYAHECGIIHRDIKSQNILLGEEGAVKVTDFGIARTKQSDTITSSDSKVLGSVQYISPEQAIGGYVDEKSDIYSFGIVLYEMVTGTLPFTGNNAVSIALKHVNESVKPPIEHNSNISRSLQKVILKCLEKEPLNRYTDVKHLIGDLKYLQENPNYNVDDEDILILEDTRAIKNVPIIKKTKNKNSHLLRLMLIFSSIVVLFGLIFFSVNMSSNVNDVDLQVEIPNLVGVAEQDAEMKINELNLILIVSDRINNSQYEEGTILSQIPAFGSTADIDSHVNVVVSLGPETIIVPNVVGQNIDDATQMINRDGLLINEIQYRNSNFPSGTVIRQSIPADSLVDINSGIVLVVSKGPELAIIEVANYIGLYKNEAERLIKEAGLSIGDVISEHSADFPVNKIIRQQPIEGDAVVQNHPINLWVSLGPPILQTRKLEINLWALTRQEVVTVKIERTIDGVIVYEQKHRRTEDMMYVELKDYRYITYNLYLDNTFIKEVTIDFAKEDL